MTRFLLVLVALLALAAGGIVFMLQNPESYSAQLSKTLEQNTGYEVTIKGPLTWRYWPPIALDAEGISLAVPGEETFLNINTMQFDVDLMQLLQQQRTININEVYLSSATITLRENEDGTTNWSLPDEDSAATTTTESTTDEEAIEPVIGSIRVEDIALSYKSAATGEDYQLTLNELTLGGFAQETPLAFTLSAVMRDIAGEIDNTISGSGQVQLKGDDVQLADVIVKHDVIMAGDKLPQVTTSLDGLWTGSTSQLQLNKFNITMDGMSLDMPLVADLGDNIRFSGSIKDMQMDLGTLGSTFDAEVPFSRLAGTATISGTADRVQIGAIEAQLDDSRLTGNTTYTLDPLRIDADLRFDTLTLPETPTGDGPAAAAATPAATEDTEIIPVELLSETNLHLIVRIGTLIASGMQLDSSKLEVKNNTSELDVIATARGFGGKVVFSLDSNLSTPVASTMKLTTESVEISQLTEMQGITGTLQANSDLSFVGTHLSDVNETLKGRSGFNVVNGSLDVRPIKRVALTIDTIRGKRSSVSDWPDLMPFNRMTGTHLFENGTTAGQIFNAELENLSIMGTGGFDLTTNTMDYRVSTMFESAQEGAFKVSDQLAGIRWPIHCKGSISNAPADLCFGEEGAISSLVAEVVKQDLQRRGEKKLDELIDDKVPDEYKDVTKDLLKKLFK